MIEAQPTFILGQLENTLLRTAGRGANLCALLSDDLDIRSTVSEMLKTIEAVQKEDIRGYQLAAIFDADSPAIDLSKKKLINIETEIMHFLQQLRATKGQAPLSIRALSFEKISYRGLQYGVYNSVHFSDSTIIFQNSEENQKLKAGLLQSIFRPFLASPSGDDSTTLEIYAVVRELQPIVRQDIVDPYTRFGFAAGWLCEADGGQVSIIDFSTIRCHFIMTKFALQNMVHVLPLDQVSSIRLPVHRLF